MMRPIALRMFRFGVFTTETEFIFPDGPGLYFMRGENAAGKSTLLVKAMTWAVFGKDPRGLKAGNVATWKQPKGAWVEFDFENTEDGKTKWYSVRRSHAPNSWTFSSDDRKGDHQDLVDDETNPLLRMLKLDFEVWLHTVMMAQRQPMFLDLLPTAKAELFSSVMNLDRWLDASDKASQKQKALDGVIRGYEHVLADLEGQRRGNDIKALTKAMDEWENRRRTHLRELGDQFERALIKSAELKATLPVLEEEASFKRDLLSDLTKWTEEDRPLYQEARDTLEAARTALAVADAEMRRLKTEVEGKPGVTKKCPTCGAVIGTFEHARHAGELKQQLAAAAAARNKADEWAGQCATVLRTREIALGQRETALRNGALDVADAQNKHNNARNDYERNEKLLDGIEDEADRIKAEANPHARLHQAATQDARRVQDEIARASKLLIDATERHSKLGFWVRGFKDLRLQQIAESLQQLEIEVNSCVTSHGLGGWELTFAVDKETKSGSIQRGFNVFVKSPHNDAPVPWESWSGGEAQRLRVAGQEGLSNLFRSRTGSNIALEVWDEPTDGTDAAGLRDLLKTLSARAAFENRQIWIIDHRALGHGGFDGGATIIKTEDGPRVVMD